MTGGQYRKVMRAVFGMFVAFVVLVAGLRVSDVSSKRTGCERGKLDRAANAAGWRTAEVARRASWERDREPSDLVAADQYDAIADGLEVRARISCADLYPYVF